jgi:hypothetical protein
MTEDRKPKFIGGNKPNPARIGAIAAAAGAATGLLGADGKRLNVAAYAHQRATYEAMRAKQHEEDMIAMLLSLDPAEFKKHKLRYNQPEPPNGFGDVLTVMLSMHMMRVAAKPVPMDERMKSVRYLSATGVALPAMVKLDGDELTGKLIDLVK